MGAEWRGIVREEWFLGVSVASVLVFAVFGDALYADLANPIWLGVIFAWLFVVVLGSCLNVVRHADGVAHALGEPYGTLVLTLSVTTIEVLSITSVMLHGENNPTLVRDTLFSVVMIILGGTAGLALLLGGWLYREQHYNLQGANSYLGVIIPLAVLSLTLPNVTRTVPGPFLSSTQQVFVAVVSAGLYCAFLAIQTGTHRSYFTSDEEAGAALEGAPKGPPTAHPSVARHALLLVAHMLPVAFLAEALAHPIDQLIETLHQPAAIGGVIVAMLVATPESIAAARAAITNHLQQATNIFLGSVLSTIGLTVPVMLIVGHFTGREVVLGLSGANDMLLLLTLAVSVITFASGRTNVVQGAVHIVLFLAFLLLIFEG